jgi:hypothetical protein
MLGHNASRMQWVPRAVPLPGVSVRQVALGPWHGALVSSGGAVYTWGDGVFGALGHGDTESQRLPRKVGAIAGHDALQVACGVWHTAALARAARPGEAAQAVRLFTWGDGDKGQLGTGRKGVTPTPVCVEGELAGQSVKQVACGAFHTVALTVVGGVFVAGKDCSGPSKPAFRPVQGALAGLRADQVACGDAHTAVVASQRRSLFTWGTGAGGRLGHGDLSDCDAPKLVDRLRDRHVVQVACGPQCTAVVCACIQLSVEQKAALARSGDEANAVKRTRRAATKTAERLPAPPASAPAPPAAASASAGPARGALLALSAQVAPSPAVAAAAEWRARLLEAEVHSLRTGLGQATAEVDALRKELAVSRARFAQLSGQPEPSDGSALAARPSAESPPAEPRSEPRVAEPAQPPPAAAAPPHAASEAVQEVEPGVFLTVSAGNVLRRVRFDRRMFTDDQAQEWWENNRVDVMQRLELVLPSARSRRSNDGS